MSRLVILNDSECPEARMIVVVRENDGIKWWSYVSTWDQLKDFPEWSPVMREKSHTPIEQFGVSARLDGDMLIIERAGPSVATYSDGHPRNWQRNLPNKTRVRPEVLFAVRDAVSLSQTEGSK
jgi:hypothetical protein